MVIGGDLKPGAQTSIGRRARKKVDGTYTLGEIGGINQLLYAPLYNRFGGTPTITRLTAPPNATALTVIDIGDGTTDLLVSAGAAIYYFAADKQQDQATGQLLMSNTLFQDVAKIYAYKSSTQYVIWGLNRANQVFYTACDINDILDPDKWSIPLPIIKSVDSVSPYSNKADNAHTIFTAGSNTINISVRAPGTTIWHTEPIHLAATPQTEAETFSSYTTRVQLDNGENNPGANTAVLISASSPIPVYINHLYYLLDATPIPVTSDNLGSLTIIEAIEGGLNSVQLTIAEPGGKAVTINPMEKPFSKIIALNSRALLRSAVITSPDGTTRQLIGSDISDLDLDSVAQANVNLARAYVSISAKNVQKTTNLTASSPLVSAQFGPLGDIVTGLGDLFKWLESGVEHIVELIKNKGTGLWHFVVKIGGEIYHGVLDTVEVVVGAVRWIYNAIKVGFEDLIKYLAFLFEWNDITRTKEVLKNVIKQYFQHQADQIEVVKETLNKQIGELVHIINGWAGIDDWSGLGEAATQPVNASATPNKNSSAPGSMMSFHLSNNVNNIRQNIPSEPLTPSKTLIDILLGALKQEDDVLDVVFEQLKKLGDDYTNLDLNMILKRLVAIVAAGVLESAGVVMGAMLDIVYELVTAVLDILDTPIYIPVVSDILKSFGVHSVSLLDLFCWITAIPVTISYKIGKGKAPFPDDENTTFLTTASTWESIEAAFIDNNDSPAQREAAMLSTTTLAEPAGNSLNIAASHRLISLPETTKSAVFISGHAASGFFTLMSCFVSTFEAEAPPGLNPFSIPSAIIGVLAAGTTGIAGVLVPKAPIKEPIVKSINTLTTGAVILSKLIFSGPAQNKFGAASGTMNILKAEDGRATGAVINGILVIPALACTCWHLYELAQTSTSDARSAAIIDETSNVTAYISRISYAVAVNADPVNKQIPIGIMVIANVATAGLQTAEAIVGA